MRRSGVRSPSAPPPLTPDEIATIYLLLLALPDEFSATRPPTRPQGLFGQHPKGVSRAPKLAHSNTVCLGQPFLFELPHRGLASSVWVWRDDTRRASRSARPSV